MSRKPTLDELKDFIYEENRDFSNSDNFIHTVGDTVAFIYSLLETENTCETLEESYRYWLSMLKNFPDNEFLTMIYYADGVPKWEA